MGMSFTQGWGFVQSLLKLVSGSGEENEVV